MSPGMDRAASNMSMPDTSNRGTVEACRWATSWGSLLKIGSSKRIRGVCCHVRTLDNCAYVSLSVIADMY